MEDKQEYVRKARQTRRHTCHWPGCDRQVPPAMWGCKPHWFRLPIGLRRRIWNTFAPGQEAGSIGVTPEYLDAADAVQAWISEHS